MGSKQDKWGSKHLEKFHRIWDVSGFLFLNFSALKNTFSF